jgi:hypothetical protein
MQVTLVSLIYTITEQIARNRARGCQCVSTDSWRRQYSSALAVAASHVTEVGMP